MAISIPKGKYQQYKADTNTIAEWLAVTSRAHGYSGGDAPATKPQPRTGGRPKGKARKAAKAAISNKSAGRKAYLIKIRDFEPMAQFLSKVPGLQVPQYFGATLNRVITAREEFMRHLNGSEEDSQQPDSGHPHLVSVLRTVRSHLQPHMAAPAPAVNVPASKTLKAKNNVVQNMFRALQIYDTSSTFQSAPDVIPARSNDVEYVAEDGYDEMDAFFAFTTLLDDFTHFREEVMVLWAEYQAGKRDLAAISVAINLAVEMAHAMEDDVEPLLSIVSTCPIAFAEAYLKLLCGLEGINLTQKQDPQHPYNLEAYELANTCLVNTISLVDSYKKTLQDGFTLQVYNGSLGWYDDKLGGGGKTNLAKWEQDKTATMELMADLAFLGWKLGCGSIVDELTRGMAEMINNPGKHVPLWFGLAVQIYLDVLQSDGPPCNTAFDEMQQEILRVKNSMSAVPNESPERGRVLEVVGIWDTDPIRAARQTFMDLGIIERSEPGTEFKFLRRHPVYCGLLTHRLRCAVHTSGAAYLAAPGALVGIVQLYHMMREKQVIAESETWQDLETIWKLQGDASFFVGNRPATYKDAFTNYGVAIGTSVRNWASDRKGKTGHVKIKADNRRNLRFMGHLSLAINHRLEHPGQRVPWSSATIAHQINEGVKKRYTDSRQHFIESYRDIVEEARLKVVQMSPGELLYQLATDVESEMSGICFSLFTMHNQAWGFLKLLQSKMIQLGGPAFAGGEATKSLPYICGMALSFAAGRDLEASTKFEGTDWAVHIAADALREFLANGQGDVVQKEMENREMLRRVDYPEAPRHDPWGVKSLASALYMM